MQLYKSLCWSIHWSIRWLAALCVHHAFAFLPFLSITAPAQLHTTDGVIYTVWFNVIVHWMFRLCTSVVALSFCWLVNFCLFDHFWVATLRHTRIALLDTEDDIDIIKVSQNWRSRAFMELMRGGINGFKGFKGLIPLTVNSKWHKLERCDLKGWKGNLPLLSMLQTACL